jgi:Ulp1 family protease
MMNGLWFGQRILEVSVGKSGPRGSKPQAHHLFLILSSQPLASNEIVIEKFNITITKDNLNCLLPGTHLTDEVINFYIAMLQEHNKEVFLLNSHFYGFLTNHGNGFDFPRVKNWTKRVRSSRCRDVLTP